MRSDLHTTKHNTDNCWYKDNCSKYQTEDCCWKCRKMQQTKYMLDLSNLETPLKSFTGLDITRLNKFCAEYIEAVLYDPTYFVDFGYNLYFYGNTGTGKTSWACRILLEYFAQVAESSYNQCRGLFVSVPTLLRDIKCDIGHPHENPDFMEFIRTIETTDLVIWDDIGITIPTDYETLWLYSLITKRLLGKKANIFTSNMNPEIYFTEQPQLASRICVVSDCVEFTGLDLRSLNSFASSIQSFKDENPGAFDYESENYIGILYNKQKPKKE